MIFFKGYVPIPVVVWADEGHGPFKLQMEDGGPEQLEQLLLHRSIDIVMT